MNKTMHAAQSWLFLLTSILERFAYVAIWLGFLLPSLLVPGLRMPNS
jgi:hypothetical protein